jgi:membrane protein
MPKHSPKAWMQWPQKALRFLEELPGEAAAASPLLRRVQTFCQFVYLVSRGFVDNRGPTRAAALSYTTLLALVPLLAVGLGLSKTLLRDASAELVPKLMDQLVSNIAPALQYMPATGGTNAVPVEGRAVVSSEAKLEVVHNIQSYINNINTGALSAVGTVLLVFVGIRMLMTVEATFNDIWGVSKGRSFWKKIVYYWASITLGPLLLITAMYLTGRAEFISLVQDINIVPGITKFIWRFVPFIILWVGFALLYALMPNTRVRFVPALVGGIVGGTLWQLNNLLSTMYISRVMTYSKIYGAFGIIPVLLVGLYFSWLIILFGAQVSFAVQNVKTYFQERASRRIDQHRRELLACRLMRNVCRNFLTGAPALTTAEWAEELNAPLQALNRIAQRLTECGLLSESGDTASLLPARPPESFTVSDVLGYLRVENDQAPVTNDTVADVLAQLTAAGKSSPSNMNFRDFAAV